MTSGTDVSAILPRQRLTRYLCGSGIEMGPGHQPMVVPFPGIGVKYVDRWEPTENLDLFPELGDADFPRPDFIANLDVDRLKAIDDQSQDFVIASHILEHMADPLGQIEDIHRILRPGGILLLLLPDRRFTFDSTRPPTPLAHLVADHAAGEQEVSDEHIEEFLRHTGSWEAQWDDDPDADSRREVFAVHRKRSIHVHCWTEDEFVAVIEHTIVQMAMTWELLDALFVADVPNSFEFGLVLQRSPVPLEPTIRRHRLQMALTSIRQRSPGGGPPLGAGAPAESRLHDWMVRVKRRAATVGR